MNRLRWATLAGLAVAVAVTAVVLQTARPPDAETTGGGDDRPAPRIPTGERVAMQQALNSVVLRGSSGTVAELARTDGGRDDWNGTAGVADRQTGGPIDPGAHFRIASLSKPIVAATVMVLVQEGKVDLDDTVEKLLPGVVRKGGDRITLRMLLSHSSGLFNYSRDMPNVAGDRGQAWRPRQLVDVANSHRPEFAPGARVKYSNTNYVLAAMVIEKVTGRPYAEVVTDRVITPLGLKDTSIPRDTRVPAPALRAYLPKRPSSGGDSRPLDITRFNPSRWYGAAEVVSTVSDINTFWEKLLGGKLLDRDTLGRMLDVQGTTSTGYGYALGVWRYQLSCGTKVWMHSGNIPGYRNWTVHTKNRHFTMFQARYVEDPDPPAWQAIETAMCPTGGRTGEPDQNDYPSEPVDQTGRGHDG